MGMDNHTVSAEIMFHLGYDPLNSELWYRSNESTWPPGLQDVVSGLTAKEINLLLYRAAEEERETIGTV
jgi:hypothetical protein